MDRWTEQERDTKTRARDYKNKNNKQILHTGLAKRPSCKWRDEEGIGETDRKTTREAEKGKKYLHIGWIGGRGGENKENEK